MLEYGAVNFVVPDYTTRHAGVAHNLCAGAAAYTHFFGIHPAFCDNVFCKVRIRECHTSGTDQADKAAGFICRRNVRKKSSQPAITRPDHGDVGELLLNLTRKINEPVDTHQRMFRLLVTADNRFVEGSAHVRIVIRIRYRDIHQPETTLLKERDKLLRLGQIGLSVVFFIDGPAVGIGNRIVNSEPHRNDGIFAELLTNLLDDLKRESRSVLE